MKIVKARSQAAVVDAASLMRGLYEANKALYHDDLETIEEYYRGSWFFEVSPAIPVNYRPPQGDVLVAYLKGMPAGTVAIYRMGPDNCELKSMFVAEKFRGAGVARALCEKVIELAKDQGYRSIRLTTGIRQKPARRLYEGLGFKIVKPWDTDPPEGYDYFELGIAQDNSDLDLGSV
ncbi:GNAT family N-acetyltransferase [Roseovarius aestuariivivens]|uniref:GNAT family N-acetyltransferase n=1 Tax=Roseovarius aestuariivivens TaxID=1888910 RepID=UPI0010802AB0|nr:GNAT family N-acetyltransferase [Roseovarius aestuariivivens]